MHPLLPRIRRLLAESEPEREGEGRKAEETLVVFLLELLLLPLLLLLRPLRLLAVR